MNERTSRVLGYLVLFILVTRTFVGADNVRWIAGNLVVVGRVDLQHNVGVPITCQGFVVEIPFVYVFNACDIFERTFAA